MSWSGYSRKQCHRAIVILNILTVRAMSLFVSDGFDRIHSCGFSCREISESHTDDGADDEAYRDAPSRNARGQMEYHRGEGRCYLSENDSDDASRQRYYHRLDEKLIADINASGANRHSETYLLGALRHAYEHDIHDAYACYEEGECRCHDEDYRHCVHSR